MSSCQKKNPRKKHVKTEANRERWRLGPQDDDCLREEITAFLILGGGPKGDGTRAGQKKKTHHTRESAHSGTAITHLGGRMTAFKREK